MDTQSLPYKSSILDIDTGWLGTLANCKQFLCLNKEFLLTFVITNLQYKLTD